MQTFDLSNIKKDEDAKVLLPDGRIARVRHFDDGVLIDLFADEADFEAREPAGGVTVG